MNNENDRPEPIETWNPVAQTEIWKCLKLEITKARSRICSLQPYEDFSEAQREIEVANRYLTKCIRDLRTTENGLRQHNLLS